MSLYSQSSLILFWWWCKNWSDYHKVRLTKIALKWLIINQRDCILFSERKPFFWLLHSPGTLHKNKFSYVPSASSNGKVCSTSSAVNAFAEDGRSGGGFAMSVLLLSSLGCQTTTAVSNATNSTGLVKKFVVQVPALYQLNTKNLAC